MDETRREAITLALTRSVLEPDVPDEEVLPKKSTRSTEREWVNYYM